MAKYSKLHPSYFFFHLGKAYYTKKDYKKSIEYYDKAVILDEKNYAIYNSLGISYDDL